MLIDSVCLYCGINFVYKKETNRKGIFCSRRCSCKHKHTREFQSKAGKAGGAVKIALRGIGTKSYIKELGRHQHRVVAERVLKRKLRSGEIVHHIDGNKKNNAPTNLKVLTQSEHIKIHIEDMHKIRKIKCGY